MGVELDMEMIRWGDGSCYDVCGERAERVNVLLPEHRDLYVSLVINSLRRKRVI